MQFTINHGRIKNPIYYYINGANISNLSKMMTEFSYWNSDVPDKYSTINYQNYRKFLNWPVSCSMEDLGP